MLTSDFTRAFRSRVWRLSPLVATLVISLALNVALSRAVLTLRGTIEYMKSESRLKEGQVVARLRGTDLTSRTVVLDYAASRATLIYFVSPTCGWCKRNRDSFVHLATAVAPKAKVVLASLGDGASLDDLTHGLPPETIILGKTWPEAKSQFKITGTPETVLITSDGHVAGVWRGAYARTTQNEVEIALNRVK